MRKLLLITVLTFVASQLFGQWPLMDFNTEPTANDTTFWTYSQAPTTDTDTIDISYITDEVYEGARAMELDYRIEDSESWGGFAKLEHFYPDTGGTFDFSAFTDLSFSYYVSAPQSIEGSTQLRVCLWDVSDSPNGDSTYVVDNAEYWYSFHQVLDSEPGWNTQTISLEGVLGADQANSELFQMTNWTGISGNETLDLDKIKAIAIELSIASSQPDPGFSEGVIILDNFILEGVAEMPLVFFNGRTIPGNVTLSSWSGTVGPEEGTGIPNAEGDPTNTIRWDVGAQWSGPNFTLAQSKNLLYRWSLDTVKLNIKADAGVGQLRLDFIDTDLDGDGTDDYPFEAHYLLEESDVGYDGTWKEVAIPLREFDRTVGYYDADGNFHSGNFDSTQTSAFRIVNSGGDASDQTIRLDNIWTGNPPIDNTDPAEVQNVSATPNTGAYYNLVTWQDVPDESYESYNVYASTFPIDDVTDPWVDLIAEGIGEDISSVPHYIYNPFDDTQRDYYYAVECIDQAGNTGPAGVSGAITGTARGIATISLDVPTDFAADGDFTEWNNIVPFEIKPSVNNVAVGSFDDDNDLTATIWLALDAEYLYIAADIIDDSYHHGDGDWWNQDAIEMFLGLYDYKWGAKHSSYQRGAEPDFNLSIRPDGLHHQNKGQAIISLEEDFYWESGGTMDYFIETRIAIDSLLLEGDEALTPEEGMRIPMDLYIHDNDDGTAEGNVAFSPHNEDTGWQNPREWTYTWLGEPENVSVEDGHNVIHSFKLSQNYPNPFNPNTTIAYALPTDGKVTLSVYNVLGEKVATLLNEHKRAGEYQVEWNATGFSSGVYFYTIEAAGFHQTKKMVLMK
ncbi:MAG: hypothetical protein MAGBODY4_01405 [Candidatus Marinimicrobia bacterium]|nr:hypothetical protein [Candidatus Neomarinimicrobiota bacterium]